MKRRKPTIAILSDQTLFRRGLSKLLRAHGFHHLAEYATSADLKAAAHTHTFDVVLVDLDHASEDTLTLVRALRHDLFDTRIVVIGTALRQGAADSFDGEIETPSADVPTLVAATQLDARTTRQSTQALQQRRLWESVTPRQRDVMRWLTTGADNLAIARKLRVGDRAVKAHVSALLDVFGVENRTQLALLADRAGIRPPRRAHDRIFP